MAMHSFCSKVFTKNSFINMYNSFKNYSAFLTKLYFLRLNPIESLTWFQKVWYFLQRNCSHFNMCLQWGRMT